MGSREQHETAESESLLLTQPQARLTAVPPSRQPEECFINHHRRPPLCASVRPAERRPRQSFSPRDSPSREGATRPRSVVRVRGPPVKVGGGLVILGSKLRDKLGIISPLHLPATLS